MKKVLKLLLVSTSILSIGALATTLSVKKVSSFNYSSAIEGNDDYIGVKKAIEGAEVETPEFTTGEKTLISPAVTQAKTNENATKSIRLVSAVTLENDETLSSYLEDENKEIGFHVSYTKSGSKDKIDAHIRVQNAYRSITAGETVYRASGTANEGDKTITDWVNACGDIVSPIAETTYNYFICLEITEIGEADLDTIITAQPYVKDGDTYTYASNYKKTNANEKSLYFLDVNGTQTLMEENPSNGTTELGDIKDEYMLTKVSITEGSSVTIRDSFGISHNKYEHSVTGIGTDFIAPKTCQYNFYYKSTKNTNKQDETYIQQQLVVHKLVTKSWWRTANALTGIYLIEKGQDISPSTEHGAGQLMTLSSTKISDQDTYEYEVDTFKYPTCYFTRVNPGDTKQCWNYTNKTSTQGKDVHYLDNNEWSNNIW